MVIDAPQQRIPEPVFMTYVDVSMNRPAESETINFDFAQDARIASAPASGGNVENAKVQNYGSIQSMDLPNHFVAKKQTADAGYLNLDENDARVFQSKNNPNTTIAAWHSTFPSTSSHDIKSIQQQPPHALSDPEFFKISALMAPGPWSGDGRNHELAMRSEEINGKKAFVYDYWRTADRSKDGFDAQPGPNDIKGRVVFFPNTDTGKVDVLYMQSPVNQFDTASADFDKSLRSIKWK